MSITAEENSELRWYALRVAGGRENTAAVALRKEIDAQGAQDLFGKIWVPSENVVDVSSGKKRHLKRNFFPGYLLVQMEKNDQTYQLLRRVNGISGFVRGMNARALSPTEVENLMSRVRQSEAGPKLKVQFHVGELVRVKDGPFADFNGAVEKIMAEKHRLVVSVFIFGRSTPIELEYGQVEKAV